MLLLLGGITAFALLSGDDEDNNATDPTTTSDSVDPSADPTAGPTEDPTAASTEDPTESPTDASPSPTTEPTTEPTDASPSPTDEPTEEPEGDDAAYCAQMTQFQTEFTNFGGGGTVSNEQLNSMVSSLEGLQEVAPADVSDDVNTLVAGFGSLDTVLDDLGITFEGMQDPAVLQEQAVDWTPEQLKSLKRLDKELNGPEFQGAGDALDQDYATRC